MTKSPSFDGGCACGAVRYRAKAGPMIVQACHCRWCQRESGSAFALNALIEASNLELTAGETEGVATPTASGRGQEVHRCPDCKVAVWSFYGGFKQMAFLRVGSLDNPDAMPPDLHIWTSSKQPWLRLPDGAKAVDEYYKAAEVWPEASLARRKALFS